MATNRRWYPESLAKAVILDTNFLFIPLKFKVDIFSELERLYGIKPTCLITQATLRELEFLKIDANPSFLKEILFAERIAQKCKIVEIQMKNGEKVDEHILRYAQETHFSVATNDSELKKKLRKKGISIIYLKQKTYLEIESNT